MCERYISITIHSIIHTVRGIGRTHIGFIILSTNKAKVVGRRVGGKPAALAGSTRSTQHKAPQHIGIHSAHSVFLLSKSHARRENIHALDNTVRTTAHCRIGVRSVGRSVVSFGRHTRQTRHQQQDDVRSPSSSSFGRCERAVFAQTYTAYMHLLDSHIR